MFLKAFGVFNQYFNKDIRNYMRDSDPPFYN